MRYFDFSADFLRRNLLTSGFVTWIRKKIYDLLDCLAGVTWSKPDENIVLVVRVDNIGDFVLWLESANHLEKHFSPRRLVLVANAAFSEVAERCACFDEVIPVDMGRFVLDRIYRFYMLRRVRRVCAAVAIQPTYSRVIGTGDTLVRASGATQRIGSVGDLANMSSSQHVIADQWYTCLVPAAKYPMTEIERNYEFVNNLRGHKAQPMIVKLAHVAEWPSLLKNDKDYFIIFPGASWTGRMWPIESFSAAARSIHAAYGWRVVVCGTRTKGELAWDFIKDGALTDVLDLCGKTSLPELVEVIRGAKLLISNETSAVHIAAAVCTPSVCVLGGGHFGRFLPYPSSVVCMRPVVVFERMSCFSCNWHCHLSYEKRGAVPCIAAIKVRSVVVAAHQAIREA
jgi:ADP-heptose:LPS heptosyltransferase